MVDCITGQTPSGSALDNTQPTKQSENPFNIGCCGYWPQNCGERWIMGRYKVRIPRKFCFIILTSLFDGVHPLEFKEGCIWFRYDEYARIFREKGYTVETYWRRSRLQNIVTCFFIVLKKSVIYCLQSGVLSVAIHGKVFLLPCCQVMVAGNAEQRKYMNDSSEVRMILKQKSKKRILMLKS